MSGAPNASTPPSKTLGGVEVTLEHETGLEPATPTLAKGRKGKE
jgi:hypothetical protein